MREEAGHDSVEALDALLDVLDKRARDAEGDSADAADQRWAIRRRHARYPFRCECTVRFPSWEPGVVSELSGHTRNISRGGVGLLVKRLFAGGDVIEIQLHAKQSEAPSYLAGEVRFCRYAGRGHYEVGLALKIASKKPVFSDRPALAAALAQSLRDAEFPE
jgi:hypothetical protein